MMHWFILGLLLFVTCPVGAIESEDGVQSAGAQSADTVQPQDTAKSEDDGLETDDGKNKQDPDRFRFLPIPIFITEPAIGTGLGVALTVFHPVKKGAGELPPATTPSSIAQMDNDKEAPPVVSAAFAAYTDSKTWVAGVGHFNNWREDSIRYAGALAAARINSDFYVLGLPIAYSMEGVLLYQDIKFRLGSSKFFLGTSLSYLDADNSFGLNQEDLVPQSFTDIEVRNVGLALRGSYETRDNMMDPNNGQLIELSVWRYDEAIGGGYDYWSSKFKALYFHQFREKFTLGLRLEVSGIDGRPPFFGYPWVKLRGIPAMRYQDKIAGAVEVEGRYLLAPKWQVLAFAGKGFTSDDVPFFDNPDNIYNFGVGARYNIFESHKVWAGLDVARGPDEWTWYIQVGHPW